MDMQDVKNLTIREGSVKTVHDSDGRLLWSAVGYDAKYVGDTTQQEYSGKNLLPNGITSQSFHGVTIIKNADGSLTLNGLVETGEPNYSLTLGSFPAVSGVKYTISGVTGWNYNTLQLFGASSVAFPVGNRIQCYNGPQTVTAQGNENVDIKLFIYQGQNYENVVIYPMVEQSASATDYEPYVGGTPSPNPDYPQNIDVVTGTQTVTISDGQNSEAYTLTLGIIELCKIGTYQDYIYKNGSEWYVHKECEKVQIDGSVGNYNSTFNWYYAGIASLNVPTPLNNGNIISNYFTESTASYMQTHTQDNGICAISGETHIIFRNINYTSASTYQNWLGATQPLFYYVLATATNTKITDETLISQLEAIDEWMVRYGYTSVVSGNLPIIVDRTAL